MASELAMIMSDFPYWKERFSDCSVFVDPKNPTEIAQKIEFLITNPEKRIEMAKKGKELVHSTYSWESESKKLVQMYEELLS